MKASISRFWACAWILTFVLLNAHLFADDRAPIQIFAPVELTAPLTKIAANYKAAKLILRLEGELEKWDETTDAGWSIVITANPKAPFCMNSPLKKRHLLHKGDITYDMYLSMSAVSIPADNAPQVSAWAYILSPKSQEIFHSYSYEQISK
jgi:hypothetical protein